MSFAVQKFLSLTWSHLSTFTLVTYVLGVLVQKLFSTPMSWSVSPTISYSTFVILGVTVRSLVHFELIFVYSERKRFNFIVLYKHVQLPHHLLKRLPFLQMCSWNYCQKTFAQRMWIHLWVPYSVPLFFMSVLWQVMHFRLQ
jgi:hypothetical protein